MRIERGGIQVLIAILRRMGGVVDQDRGRTQAVRRRIQDAQVGIG
jgi:hypothetical protein